jgi:hypothetical protein
VPTWERRGQQLVASGGRGRFTWALLGPKAKWDGCLCKKRKENRVGLPDYLGRKKNRNRTGEQFLKFLGC